MLQLIFKVYLGKLTKINHGFQLVHQQEQETVVLLLTVINNQTEDMAEAIIYLLYVQIIQKLPQNIFLLHKIVVH